jgi:hypothetical protein
MSWSEFFSNVAVEDIPSLAHKNAATNECLKEFEEAKICAVDMIESGCLGDPNKYYFGLTFSGHANPDHKPQPGWSNDMMTISIYQGGLRTEVLAGSNA